MNLQNLTELNPVGEILKLSFVKKCLEKAKKFFHLKILKRKYYRVGKCNCCGRCCKNIYVKHGKGFIKDEKLFNRLKPLHTFYFDLEIIGSDEMGLVFACKNLDDTTNLCRIHNKRERICRDYPMEEILKMGGALADGCGFRFEPIEKFSEVLKKETKRRQKH